jgi:hypothetical protein
MVLAKRSDLNDDWRVDARDFSILAERWHSEDTSADIAPATARDGYIGMDDLVLMCEYWQEVIPEMDDCVLHWKLDETEGDTASDSAEMNHGQVGGPVWKPGEGVFGGALEFDGVDDYVLVYDVLDPGHGPFSVFVWIKGGGLDQAIVAQGTSRWIGTDVSGHLMTDIGDDSALVSPTVVTDGEWHRVGMVWDGTYRKLYVDDVEVAGDTEQQTIQSSTSPLILGRSTAATIGVWSGLMDDFKVYDRAIVP